MSFPGLQEVDEAVGGVFGEALKTNRFPEENRTSSQQATWIEQPVLILDSLRGSSVKLGTMQRRLAWPPRKDDTQKSRSVSNWCLSWRHRRVSLGAWRQRRSFPPGSREQRRSTATGCYYYHYHYYCYYYYLATNMLLCYCIPINISLI